MLIEKKKKILVSKNLVLMKVKQMVQKLGKCEALQTDDISISIIKENSDLITQHLPYFL